LRENEPAFREKGANLAAIGLGDQNYGRLFREDTGITFPLLIDEHRLAYAAAELPNGNVFHIFRSDNTAARKRAKAAGHRQHRLGANPFQLGASFIFGPGNVDLYAHPNGTFGDNASPEEILKSLPSL